MTISNELKAFLVDKSVQQMINESKWAATIFSLYKKYPETYMLYSPVYLELIQLLENIGAATQEELIAATVKAQDWYRFDEVKNYLL